MTQELGAQGTDAQGLDGQGLDPGDDFAQGRAQMAQGRHAIALEHFAVAADTAAEAAERAAALAFAAELSVLLGRPYEAADWAQRLREESGQRDQAALLEALARVRLGEGERALALLEQAREPSTALRSYPPTARTVLRAQALVLVGRPQEALAALVGALRADPADAQVWQQLAAVCADPAVDPAPAVAAFPADRFGDTVGHLLGAPPAGTDRILEAMWHARPGDPRVLALLPYTGHALPVDRALEWSARMRAAGEAEHCPLLGVAASDTRAPVERVRAAAVAYGAFRDPRAPSLVELAGTFVTDPQLVAALDEVTALAPDLMEVYLLGAAGSAPRALLLAVALGERGEADLAVALARHAAGPEGQRLPRVPAGVTPGQLDALAGSAHERGAADVARRLQALARQAAGRAGSPG